MVSQKSIVLALIVLCVLTLSGTVGYMHLEGWTFLEALYMSAITTSTVGFGEVRSLSPAGQVFTIGYIFLSVALVGFAMANITAFLIQGELKDLLKGRRMQRQIGHLKDHYILCGCGAVGREIATEFLDAKVPFVVVEKNPAEAEIPRDDRLFFLEGDATSEEVLEEAGIHRAKGLIAALHNDPENVFITLSARQLNPGLQIVVRAAEKGSESKMRQAGADRVISPFEIAGHRMAYAILRPTVVNFLDVVIREGDTDFRLEEVQLEGDSQLEGKTLRQGDVGRKTGAMIVGVHDRNGKSRFAPDAETALHELLLQPGDYLIALGNEKQIERLRALAKGPGSG